LDEKFGMSGYRGFASSPLAYGDNVILPVGGPGQAVVAFKKSSGDVAWKNQDFRLAPASPIIIDVDGQEQLVVFTPSQIVGLNPNNGNLLWSHTHETNYGLNISTPVWGDGNLLFLSSAYDGGSRVIRLLRSGGKTSVEELWFDNRLRLHFGNAIRMGNLVLGTSGDFGPAFFAAVDIVTGNELWRERTFGRSQMVVAEGLLVIVDEGGDLALATASSEKLDVLARAEVLTENAWTPPTLVGTTLYVRDRKNILAIDLGE
jgi:outer membrane protein assembly factor BamB